MLSHRAVQFDAIAKKGTKILRIKSAQLKEAIRKNSDLSDVSLDAFLLRQETVLNEIAGGLKLVGSDNSTETYAIRDFLEKNHIWYNFIDIDTKEEAKNLLEYFNLSESDLPFIYRNSKICKNPSIEKLATYSRVLMDLENKIIEIKKLVQIF